MPVLPLFREFTQWIKTEQPSDLPDHAVSRLYRAHARLRVAKRYDGIRLNGLSSALVAGYSAGVRLLLSYSAAESMGNVGLNKSVKAQLTDFVLERHDHVRVPATALRHLMAHGHFAPAGKISLKKTEINAVETLCSDLIAETERRFAAWFIAIAGDGRP